MLTISIIAVIIVVLIIAIAVARHQRKKDVAKTSKAGDVNAKQVYVGNLPYQVTEQDLKDYFHKYGSIEQVRIVRNYGSGRSKGFGFITYRLAAEAQNSLAAHGQKYQGRTIVVRIAKPR